MLDPRSRAQLRAALTFWLQAADHSRVHPSDIPACKKILSDSGELPMTRGEILILLDVLKFAQTFITARAASREFDLPDHRIRREIHRAGIQSEHGTCYYRMADMISVANTIRGRDRAKSEKSGS